MISYKKLSKKEQKAENAKKRNDWGPLNPVTRLSRNKKAYNRHDKRWKIQF